LPLLRLTFRVYGMLDDVERYQLDHGIQFRGVQNRISRMERIRVTGLGFSQLSDAGAFQFLKAHT
jgi:hypothetical protein